MKIKFALTFIIIGGIMHAQEIKITAPVKFMALGDSYTIGQSVSEKECWPVQLMDALKRTYSFEQGEVDIIATTGWTTRNLIDGIANRYDGSDDYDLVSLLIGVNNQYQGLDFQIYEPEFRTLLDKAIEIAGGDTGSVFVVSIPDYAYTPSFANNQQVSNELDQYNAVNKRVSDTYGVLYFNITDISRKGLEIPSYVAQDGLHPSGEQYGEWVKLMVPKIEVNTQTAVFDLKKNEINWFVEKGNLSISLPLSEGLLSMHDSSGRKVLNVIAYGTQETLSVSHLPAGIYFLQFDSGNEKFTGKVILD